MNEEKDFLDDFAEAEATEPGIPGDSETTSADEWMRDANGRFVAEEAKVNAEAVEKGEKAKVDDGAPVPETVPEPPSEGTETTVPISVVQKLREEIKALKAKDGTAPQPKGPEISGPQVGFEQNPQAHLMGHLHQQKMQMSRFMAAQQADEATVDAAWAAFDEACKNDPAVSAFSYALTEHHHPMGEVLNWYRQRQDLEMLQQAGGLDKLIEARLAERANGSPQIPVSGVAQAPDAPPSLTRAGAGVAPNQIPSESEAFEDLFKR